VQPSPSARGAFVTTLRPLSAAQPSFAQATENRVTVVDLWATWCEACTRTIPQVRHLAETYSSRDLVVIGVNVGEAHDVVSRYADDAQIHYPLYLDPDFAFADAVGAREVPAILIIAPDGRIVHRGSHLDREMLERLERELAARPPLPAEAGPDALAQPDENRRKTSRPITKR